MNWQRASIIGMAAGIVIGLTMGLGISSPRQSASAASTGPTLQALEKAVRSNAKEIVRLKRQVRALSKTTGALGRKVQSNRKATSKIATASGVIINFTDN